MSSGQQLPEDDDEFQEFREADWTEDKEDHEDKDLWLEDWDNEDFDDDFTKQLRTVENTANGSCFRHICIRGRI
ncbi:hypothetical protein QVD99_005378 [Batrachochytrium dendrobatidis]|nr:hypothetical protein QVD99_005378 [Batrachochytrium dendrobatidis]